MIVGPHFIRGHHIGAYFTDCYLLHDLIHLQSFSALSATSLISALKWPLNAENAKAAENAERNSEVKLINVRFVEDERRAEQHLIAVDLNLAETTRSQFVIAAFEFSVCQSIRRVDS